MALTATNWTVDRQTGNIRYIGDLHNGTAPTYSNVIDFHRWLQGLADDASSTGNDDELNIIDNTPSARSTDNIITLNAPYNIDDASSQYLYDGSIIQNGGDDVYDGFVNFGNLSVQIQIISDGAVITDDWWNKSIGGTATAGTTTTVMEDSGETWTVDEWVGYTIYNTTTGAQGIISANTADTITAAMYDDNGTNHDWADTNTYLIGKNPNADAAAGISHKFMLPTRVAGVDTDGKRFVGLSRRYGNTYGEFKVNGAVNGNNVFALSDATDLNNATAGSVVDTWDKFANDSEGFDNSQDVDLDTTAEEYYSRWDIGAGTLPASPTINDLYEYAKWITRQGSDSTLYGISGELFRGITLDVPVDGAVTTVDFAAFEDVEWSTGTGQLLAIDDISAPTRMWIQLLTGVAPTDPDTINSVTTPATTADVNGTVTDREPLLTKPFIGASTGSSLIGGYGVGIAKEDLSASDILFDLDNVQITPPNNVVVEIGGLVSGEDYVTVTQRGLRFEYDTLAGGSLAVGDTMTFSGAATATAVIAEIVTTSSTTGFIICSEAVTGSLPTGTGSDNAVITVSAVTAAVNGSIDSDINKRQYTVATAALSAANITSVEVTPAIASDTPSSGILRVQDDSGHYRRLVYDSYTGSTFTINPTTTEAYNASTATDADFDVTGAAIGNNAYIGYIDLLATGTTEDFTSVYSGTPRNLFVRARDGGGTPIKTYETTVTMSSSGGSATATRTTDE